VNLAMAGQSNPNNMIQNNGNVPGHQEQKGNNDTVYHFASG